MIELFNGRAFSGKLISYDAYRERMQRALDKIGRLPRLIKNDLDKQKWLNYIEEIRE